MASHPPVMTQAFLRRIREQPHLPPHCWYFIAAVTLSILNQPGEIQNVYTHALEHGPGPVDEAPERQEQLLMSRRIREALIKGAAIGGIPKAINAMASLKTVTPDHLIDDPLGQSPTGRLSDMYDTSPSHILKRGIAFFESVYGKVAERVMSSIENSGTGDLALVAKLVYGYILSNLGILSQAETSFVMIAGLIPQDVNPQLKGHLRGALNGGCTVDEVRAVRDVVIGICQSFGMTQLQDHAGGGWGWRSAVADL